MVERISTMDQLRIDYEILRTYEELRREVPARYTEHVKERIRDIKASIREYRDRNANPDMKVIKDYGIDGVVLLVQLPEYVKSQEDAEDYFDSKLYIPMVYSAYDCTGRAFTGWYKVFKRRGRYMVYHRIAYDV